MDKRGCRQHGEKLHGAYAGRRQRLKLNAAENALYSEIIIKDNGTGISPEDLPHIFERFYKGKDSDGKSFGIGLALSRMIIAGQKGTVKAENRKNTGAMFTLRFYKGTV